MVKLVNDIAMSIYKLKLNGNQFMPCHWHRIGIVALATICKLIILSLSAGNF